MAFHLKLKCTLALTLAITLNLAATSQAGLLMVQTYQKLGEKAEAAKKPPTENKVYLDKGKVRIETGTMTEQYFIYDGEKKIFFTVNLKDKTYMEMTEKDFSEMFSKMDEAKKKMEESMAKMPPAQKEMMQKMMAKMMPGGANGPKTTYKKISSGEKINNWSTDKYEGERDGVKHSEVWTTTPKALDISPTDFQVLLDMAKFFEKFSKNLEGMMGGNGKNGLDGVPVKTITYNEGKAEFQTEIKEIKKDAFAVSLFEVPAGFTKKESPMAKMGADHKSPKPKG